MHQFEHFFHFAAFWYRNEDDGHLPSTCEAPRQSDWLPEFRKAAQRISALAGFADET
jgi:hypothetical protein